MSSKTCHLVQRWVLASFGSLEAGPARHLFAEWAEDKSNLVILTGQAEHGSLTEQVLQLSSKAAAKKKVKLTLSRRVPLEGDELAEHESSQKTNTIEEKKEKDSQSASAPVTEEVADIQPVEQEAEPMDVLFGVTTVGSTQEADLRRRETLTEGFTPIMTSGGPMFPEEVWEPTMTDYGQEIDIEMFHRISQNASGTTVEPVHDTPMMEENPIEKVEEKVEEEEEVHEVPTKLVSETREVIIRATILQHRL